MEGSDDFKAGMRRFLWGFHPKLSQQKEGEHGNVLSI